MKTRKLLSALLLGLLILAAAFSALNPQPANAQQICTDPTTGQVIPCPPPPREKRTKIPTPIPPTRTPTPTPTPAGIPLTGGDAGGAAPAGVGGTPAVQLKAFATGSFLIGLLFLLLFLGGAFDPKRGLFKRFGVFGHSTDVGAGEGKNFILDLGGQDAAPIGRNDGNLRQGEPDPQAADYVVWRKTIGTGTQQTPVGRNDGIVQQVDLSPDATGHELAHTVQNSPADHDGLNKTWETNGNIDMNTDGSELADQGDSSSSMPKPPDSD